MRSLLLVRLVLRATAFPLQTGCGTNATVLSFTSTSSPSGMVFPSPTAPSAAMVFSKPKRALHLDMGGAPFFILQVEPSTGNDCAAMSGWLMLC